MIEKVDKESELDLSLFRIIHNGKATLLELQKDYNLEDAYDLLEIIDIEEALDNASKPPQKER